MNHIQLYDGCASYNVESAEESAEGAFSPKHIEVKDIACNLSLKRLSSDTLSLYIRSISGRESSGIEIKKLRARVNANTESIRIEDFRLELPQSKLLARKLILKTNGKRAFEIDGEIYSNAIVPYDFKALCPALAADLPALSLRVKAKGNNKRAMPLSLSRAPTTVCRSEPMQQ